MIERIYLDTNVYCRPLDNQDDRRISRVNSLHGNSRHGLAGEIHIISSNYLKFEIEQIQDPLKIKDVRGFERTLSVTSIEGSHSLRDLARDVAARCSVNALDALHISAACFGEAAFFLTCDDEVLSKRECIEKLATQKGCKLKVRDPIKYLREWWDVKI